MRRKIAYERVQKGQKNSKGARRGWEVVLSTSKYFIIIFEDPHNHHWVFLL